MSARKFVAAFTFACSSIIFVPSFVLAQDSSVPVAPEVENSKYQFEGRINSSAVYIRSGPSDNDYPTMKLDRDAVVTVVGEKFAWLKILPPKDSFCYVAKAYVEKRGAGNVGRVTQPLNVRVGSNLNPMKTKIAAKLDAGQDVQIVGEQDEYFKVAPPEGVFVYVNKQFVDPIRVVTPDQPKQETPAVASNDSGNAGQSGSTTGTEPGPITTNTPQVPPTADNASGQQNPPPVTDASQPKPEVAVVPPSTQPVESSTAKAGLTQEQAEQEFDRLSSALSVASHQTLDQQPLEDLQAGYEKLVASHQLPNTLQIRAESDLTAIRSRVQDKARYTEVLKKQEEMKQNRLALEEERRELEKRIANSSVQTYSALGTLRLSSLQSGSETLYRLTDPRTGSTLVYIRSNDQQFAQMVGQFIGVRGQIAEDTQLQLKVISLAGAEVVDPAKVNTRVLAPIVPPSMLPQSGTAKTE